MLTVKDAPRLTFLSLITKLDVIVTHFTLTGSVGAAAAAVALTAAAALAAAVVSTSSRSGAAAVVDVDVLSLSLLKAYSIDVCLGVVL